ncbi:hypothetical protein B0H14DRAFT_2578175 [Mycena olivaceomarginata]|nr:hypothetical protein B0H14DRAFT_2578175 [Mycena olivaceomarginata]
MSVSSPPGPDGPVLSTSCPFGLEIRSHTSLTSELLPPKEATATKPGLRLGCPRRLTFTTKGTVQGAVRRSKRHGGYVFPPQRWNPIGQGFSPTGAQAALWKAEFAKFTV